MMSRQQYHPTDCGESQTAQNLPGNGGFQHPADNEQYGDLPYIFTHWRVGIEVM